MNIGKPVMRSADEAEQLPLFRKFPAIATKLPHVSLGIFPTPVEKADQLGSALGLDRFYMKRDDLSGAVYGGNKVRMLEFLLGGALRANAREVVTVGYAGSNHALALAILEEHLASPWLLRRRYRDTSAFLHKLDPSFPKLDCPRESLEIRNDCLGKGYAHYTAKDVESASLMREH